MALTHINPRINYPNAWNQTSEKFYSYGKWQTTLFEAQKSVLPIWKVCSRLRILEGECVEHVKTPWGRGMPHLHGGALALFSLAVFFRPSIGLGPREASSPGYKVSTDTAGAHLWKLGLDGNCWFEAWTSLGWPQAREQMQIITCIHNLRGFIEVSKKDEGLSLGIEFVQYPYSFLFWLS